MNENAVSMYYDALMESMPRLDILAVKDCVSKARLGGDGKALLSFFDIQWSGKGGRNGSTITFPRNMIGRIAAAEEHFGRSFAVKQP